MDTIRNKCIVHYGLCACDMYLKGTLHPEMGFIFWSTLKEDIFFLIKHL